MPHDESIETISDKIKRKVEQMLNNAIPLPSCPLKRQQAEWKRSEVLRKLFEQNSVGPSLIK